MLRSLAFLSLQYLQTLYIVWMADHSYQKHLEVKLLVCCKTWSFNWIILKRSFQGIEYETS